MNTQRRFSGDRTARDSGGAPRVEVRGLPGPAVRFPSSVAVVAIVCESVVEQGRFGAQCNFGAAAADFVGTQGPRLIPPQDSGKE